jgi:hypothetical protein
MVVHRADAAAFFDKKIEEDFKGIATASLDHIAHTLAGEFLVLGIGQGDELHSAPVAADSLVVVVPVFLRSRNILFHASSHGGILEALHRLRVAAVLCPRWDDGAKAVLSGGVWIDISANVVAFGARLGDHRDDLTHLAPKLLVSDLDVDIVHPDICAFADVDGFLDGAENASALVSTMGRVDTAVLPGNFCQLDQLRSGD